VWSSAAQRSAGGADTHLWLSGKPALLAATMEIHRIGKKFAGDVDTINSIADELAARDGGCGGL
jgi:hypothetical protein